MIVEGTASEPVEVLKFWSHFGHTKMAFIPAFRDILEHIGQEGENELFSL